MQDTCIADNKTKRTIAYHDIALHHTWEGATPPKTTKHHHTTLPMPPANARGAI